MGAVYTGYIFDVMDYVVQEIKTEMVNEKSDAKIMSLIKVFETLTKWDDEHKAVLYEDAPGQYSVVGYKIVEVNDETDR
jgi:hypothetical protein